MNAAVSLLMSQGDEDKTIKMLCVGVWVQGCSRKTVTQRCPSVMTQSTGSTPNSEGVCDNGRHETCGRNSLHPTPPTNTQNTRTPPPLSLCPNVLSQPNAEPCHDIWLQIKHSYIFKERFSESLSLTLSLSLLP